MKLEEIARYHWGLARSAPEAADRTWHRRAAEFLGELAQQKGEHARRIRQGMAEARAQGKPLGRKRIAADVEARAREMLAGGAGVAEVMGALGIGGSTITRIRREAGMPPGKSGRPAGEE